eukprot:COSAG02_NODE_18609_length_929_cov_1.596386_1_plen_101_part_10
MRLAYATAHRTTHAHAHVPFSVGVRRVRGEGEVRGRLGDGGGSLPSWAGPCPRLVLRSSARASWGVSPGGVVWRGVGSEVYCGMQCSGKNWGREGEAQPSQ